MSIPASSLTLPASVAIAAPAEVAVQAAALSSLQAIHEQLTACGTANLASPHLADFAVYFYCAYQAFGRPADGALAQQLARRLAAQPWPGTASQWTAPHLDQACALAWLAAHYPAAGLAQLCPPMLLASLDEALYQQAQALLAERAPARRSTLVQVARYLCLRLPAPTAGQYLHALLAHWPPAFAPEGSTPLALGLVDGLAAELLVLMRVHNAGVRHPTIQAQVQQGVRGLLATRRAIDFLERSYSVFPHELCPPTREGNFSAELSWRRGDLGQAWLLHGAQAILHDSELANIAELVGLNTVLRTSAPATKVVSAGLYHGAAGVAQLYALLYRASEQPAYRTAYYFWLGRTQELLPAELATTLATAIEYKPLGGLVGIGLVLLTAAKNTAIDWETMIL